MSKYACLIIIIFIFWSRFCLVSEYPGDVDPALYTLSLVSMASSPENSTLAFNYEMSFGYYWLISLFKKLVHHDICKLVTIQNYINTVFGVLAIIFFGLLTRRLTDDVTAIFGMVILTLDHSFWNWSLYGHPGVISICFFVLSIYSFDKGIKETQDNSKIDFEKGIGWRYWIFSGLAGLAALLIRVDILFVFATYALLYKYRREKHYSIKNILLFYLLVFSMYLCLKYLALGYIIAPSGGTISDRVDRSFNLETIFSSLLVNLGICIASIGIIFFITSFVAMLWWGRKHPKLLPFLFITVSPVFILFFFEHMDTARLSLVIHPFLAFFAGISVSRTIGKRTTTSV